ncbi:type VI secretion system baseplate subunit TssG [Paraburkholderia acidisoli]|uniref:Type VI secretion system baseplate subunit TssG n=1 Tax=Paraburkholderia acidisoli TaxID=2571748 RepID=A0A7Z2GMM5_9BURK|nr:type VI secretion system baseplate subunit TssG [Paraburkholderia acidisoli]QGZ64376.1 type VI secretion system baseplate subunit TssG [Paraburkholderia acidisoli]
MDRLTPLLPLSPALIDDVTALPWQHGFLALVRRINANVAIDPVGRALLARTENFRLGQKPSLIFAPSEVAQAQVKNGKLHIRLYSLGMLGPDGPLPSQVTETAREREELRNDPTLSNFLDLFHHRAFSLFYRAWAWSQPTVSLDRADNDYFSSWIAALQGYPHRASQSSLPDHARLSFTPRLVRQGRNPDGLRSAIAHYFSVPVEIVGNVLQWTPIEPDNVGRLGEERQGACMGMGARLGQMVPIRMNHFHIVIGPLDIEPYQRLMPQGADLLKLRDLVRAFVGVEYGWELQLTLKHQAATPTLLGETQKLGWTSWLGDSPQSQTIHGMCFNPEDYVPQLRRDAARRVGEQQ